jgi:RecA-family ATPase
MQFASLADLESAPIQWLFPGRIPLGALTMLDGDPGSAKSTLTYDLAARVSAGLPMPFESDALPPAGVLLLQAEDDPHEVIRPRIEAAGGDLARINVLTPDGSDPQATDLAELIAQSARHSQAKLVVIDPLPAFCSGIEGPGGQRHLAPLLQVAKSEKLAMLLVRHLTKSVARRALLHGKGSVAAIGVARSGLYVVPDPTTDHKHRRVLALSKGNLATAPALVYETVKHGEITINWLEERDASADELVAGNGTGRKTSALQAAIDFLQLLLADGPKLATEVFVRAEESQISETTLNRAKKALGVDCKKTPGPWIWSLPELPQQAG